MRHLLAIISLLLPNLTQANDSEAGFTMGTLVFRSNPHVQMMREDLLISIPTSTVRVEYQYKNKSDKDIELLVGFPIPKPIYGMAGQYPPSEPSDLNYANFKTWVNGERVIWWPLFEGDAQQQETCQNLWFERNRIFDDAGYCFQSFNAKATFDNTDCFDPPRALDDDQSQYLAKLKRQESDIGCKIGLNSELSTPALSEPYLQGRRPGFEEFSHPYETVLRRQVFSANETVTVVHEYRIDWGGGIPRPVEIIREEQFLQCPQNLSEFKQSNAEALQEHSDDDRQKHASLDYTFSSYILRTGANWNGPIGRFHLEIVTAPNSLLDVCFEGLQKVSDTSFVFEAEDFTPQKDIHFTQYELRLHDR
jgi:hypothetical protein